MEAAEAAEAAGDTATARRHLARALKLEPGFIPAVLLAARLDFRKGRKRRARKLLEQGWQEQPHPGIVEVCLEEPGLSDKPYERIKRIERLTQANPTHPESRLALAQVNLDAELWGEARKHLRSLMESTPEHRVFRMMAELEAREKGDSEKAADWLRQAETANPDPAWVCGSCGALSGKWSARCGVCDTFDTLLWRTPRHSSMNLVGIPPSRPSRSRKGNSANPTPPRKTRAQSRGTRPTSGRLTPSEGRPGSGPVSRISSRAVSRRADRRPAAANGSGGACACVPLCAAGPWDPWKVRVRQARGKVPCNADRLPFPRRPKPVCPRAVPRPPRPGSA
ncbi:tetratricopeptide repeat protein [Fodinicurvata halophila]|uniref:tetratricopeptide repeat protein n=1 Tax=Fodinicurvata halophila TaxID=1419723 RepID=UPI0036428DAA